MIVADTSALISLAIADTLDALLDEFDVHTTETVRSELAATAASDDSHGRAAQTALDHQDHLTIHDSANPGLASSRIDAGEASCTALAQASDADFLLTDDLRALPELQAVVDARVAISPIVLHALVKRGVLEQTDAATRLDELAETRDWLGTPIYRRSRPSASGLDSEGEGRTLR